MKKRTLSAIIEERNLCFFLNILNYQAQLYPTHRKFEIIKWLVMMNKTEREKTFSHT